MCAAGVQLFANVNQVTGAITDNMNFTTFGNAMAALFTMLTGENWVAMMYTCMARAPPRCCPADYELKACPVDTAPVCTPLRIFPIHDILRTLIESHERRFLFVPSLLLPLPIPQA